MNQSFTSLKCKLFHLRTMPASPIERKLCVYSGCKQLLNWGDGLEICEKFYIRVFLREKVCFHVYLISCLCVYVSVCACICRHSSTKIHVSCLSVSSTSTSINEISVNSKSISLRHVTTQEEIGFVVARNSQVWACMYLKGQPACINKSTI